jgi:hypothetical protein
LNEGRIVGLQEKVRTFFRKWLMGVVGALRPRGPLANDTTARVLHWLLIALLGWYAVYLSIILPFFIVRKAVAASLTLPAMIGWMVGLRLIRRGRSRAAALLYLTILYSWATVLIVLLGGVRTSAMVFYLAMPISAAWLLGERAALIGAGACLGTSLLLATLETAGIGMPHYFPGTPMGFLVLLLAASAFPPRRSSWSCAFCRKPWRRPARSPAACCGCKMMSTGAWRANCMTTPRRTSPRSA